jgi:hypothetical protein
MGQEHFVTHAGYVSSFTLFYGLLFASISSQFISVDDRLREVDAQARQGGWS